MIFKISKFKFYLILISIILVNFFLFEFIYLYAITKNLEKSIRIYSNIQTLDIQKNIVTFYGNVKIIQGSIKIEADKVVIIYPKNKRDNEIIDSYGHPTTFCQSEDINKKIIGGAYKIHYELEKNAITLTDNAYLTRCNNNIKSDIITYFIKEKRMHAFSKKGKRVITTLSFENYKIKN